MESEMKILTAALVAASVFAGQPAKAIELPPLDDVYLTLDRETRERFAPRGGYPAPPAFSHKIPPEELQSSLRRILRSHGRANGSVVELQSPNGRVLNIVLKWVAPALAKIGVNPGGLFATGLAEHGTLMFVRFYAACTKDNNDDRENFPMLWVSIRGTIVLSGPEPIVTPERCEYLSPYPGSGDQIRAWGPDSVIWLEQP